MLLFIPPLLFSGSNQTLVGLPGNFFFFTTVFHIGLFYLNAFYLYPKLVTRKSWWLYVLCIIAILYGSFKIKLFFLNLTPGFSLTGANRNLIFFPVLPYVFTSMLYRLISDRILFEKREKEAKAERLDAELRLLRSQVSPHFLFNMLTNLVAMARKKSNLLEPTLLRLSELLRYSLYETGSGKISLGEEFNQLENYIGLQQLRFGDDVKLTLHISNGCTNSLIEPMLLIPFIENAYKHGVDTKQEPHISINIVAKKEQLYFEVINSFNSSNQSKDSERGIGIANVKNRLALLYPGKYRLAIDDDTTIFYVRLQLELT